MQISFFLDHRVLIQRASSSDKQFNFDKHIV